jgi:hypothetical protein
MDFKNLANMNVAVLMCPYCLTMWTEETVKDALRVKDTDPNNLIFGIECPLCHQIASRDDSSEIEPLPLYPDYIHCVTHGFATSAIVEKRLATLAQTGESPNFFRTLTFLLSRAEHFVTFLSWRIDPWFLGALSVTAQRLNIGVFGIATGVDYEKGYDYQNIVKASQVLDNPKSMRIELVSGNDFNHGIGSHTKMVNIDGVFLFHGSTNMNLGSWFNAHDSRDVLSYTSNTNEIITFHNKNFAPVWYKLKKKRDKPELLPKNTIEDIPF